jgi:hypothetical protein
MRERSEVPACSQTSLFRDDGINTAIQTLEDQVDGSYTNPRETASKRICADEHYRPNSRCIECISNTDGMAQNNISLKELDLIRADDLVLKSAESGGDAVRDITALDQSVDRSRTPIDVLFGMIGQRDARLARLSIRHGKHLFKCEALAVDENFIH